MPAFHARRRYSRIVKSVGKPVSRALSIEERLAKRLESMPRVCIDGYPRHLWSCESAECAGLTDPCTHSIMSSIELPPRHLCMMRLFLPQFVGPIFRRWRSSIVVLSVLAGLLFSFSPGQAFLCAVTLPADAEEESPTRYETEQDQVASKPRSRPNPAFDKPLSGSSHLQVSPTSSSLRRPAITHLHEHSRWHGIGAPLRC